MNRLPVRLLSSALSIAVVLLAHAADVSAQSADLAVVKTAPATALAGSNVVYSIAVANNGPDAATSVSISDMLPAGTTFVSLTSPAGWTTVTPPVGGTGTVTATNASLPVAAGSTFTLVVHVAAATPDGTVISNTATLMSATADPVLVNNTATASTSVQNAADLAMTKAAPATVIAGNDVIYTLTLTNNGPGTATSVSLSDALPGGLTFVSATAPPGWTLTTPPVGGSGTITATNASVSAGSVATFTLVANVAAAAPHGATIVNSVAVATATADPDSANNVATATTTVQNAADVAIVKNAPATVTSGSNIAYTITMTNNGPLSAAAVALTDALPGATTFVSMTAPAGWTLVTPPVGGTSTVTATAASLAPGAVATFTLVVNVNATSLGGVGIQNQATVSASTPDPDAANNTSIASTTVQSFRDLSLTKIGPATAQPGGNVAYTLVVSNLSADAAALVALSDPLPAGTTFVSLIAPPGWLATTPAVGATGAVTAQVPLLASGASATLSLVVRVDPGIAAGTALTNTASVSSPSTDPAPANNAANAVTQIGSVPVIPTLSHAAIAVLAMLMVVAAVARRRR